MLSYLYVLKFVPCAVSLRLPFNRSRLWGGYWRGIAPPYLQLAFSRLYVNKILLVDIYLYNIVVYLTFRVY